MGAGGIGGVGIIRVGIIGAGIGVGKNIGVGAGIGGVGIIGAGIGVGKNIGVGIRVGVRVIRSARFEPSNHLNKAASLSSNSSKTTFTSARHSELTSPQGLFSVAASTSASHPELTPSFKEGIGGAGLISATHPYADIPKDVR